MNNHQTQVLAHLKTGKTLTQAEAINLFNCYRLLDDTADHNQSMANRYEQELKDCGDEA